MKLSAPPTERRTLRLRHSSNETAATKSTTNDDHETLPPHRSYDGYRDENTRLIQIRYRGRAIPSNTAIDMRKKCFSSSSAQWFDKRY